MENLPGYDRPFVNKDGATTSDLHVDPLWAALERVLLFFKVKVDKSLLETQVAIDWRKPLTPSDVMMITRQLGLALVVHGISGADIAGLNKPSLVLMPQSRYLVALPQDSGLPALWLPEGDIDIDEVCADTTKNLYVMEFDKVESTPTDIAGANWFWDILRKQRSHYIDIAVATFFINLFVLLTPLFSMTVFDRVVPNHAHETLIALTIGVCVAFIFNLGFKVVRGHVLSVAVAKIATKLDADFMEQLFKLKTPERALSVGARFDLFHELQGLRDFFASRLVPAIVDLPFFVLFLLVIYIFSAHVALVVVFGVLMLLGVSLVSRTTLGRRAQDNFRETRSKNSVLVEMLRGAQSIRLFNAIGPVLFRWQRLSSRAAESARQNQNATSLADDISMTIMSLISAFVIVVGVGDIETGELSVGGLVACNILVARTLSPIMSLASVLGRLRQSLDSLRTMDNIFHMPIEPDLTINYEPKGPFKGGMRLRDVTFYHAGQVNPTLYRINLDIRPRDKIGLLGRTGAGKSTIAHILEGSVVPQTGQVFVDDLILDAIHPAEWRQSLGIVPQDIFVLSGTLRENIMLGVSENVDEEWLRQVIFMSGLDLSMNQSGYGLDFEVGENGERLSGGQRQSLGIARALIRKPSILLLDEPTNGMDGDLEARVLQSLAAYTRDKTMIVITHKTSLLAMTNRLIWIDKGAVVKDGPSAEVMQSLSGTGGKNA